MLAATPRTHERQSGRPCFNITTVAAICGVVLVQSGFSVGWVAVMVRPVTGSPEQHSRKPSGFPWREEVRVEGGRTGFHNAKEAAKEG